MVLKKDKETEQEAVETTENVEVIQSVDKNTKTQTESKNSTAEEGKSTIATAKKCFIYIGPTLPNGKLKGNAVLSGSREDVSEFLKDILEDYPMVKELIVPLEELAEQRAKVKTPGNYINTCYNNVISKARK